MVFYFLSFHQDTQVWTNLCYYFEIDFLERLYEGGQWVVCYESSVIKNNLNPRWPPVSIPMTSLCNGDQHAPLRFNVYATQKSSTRYASCKVYLSADVFNSALRSWWHQWTAMSVSSWVKEDLQSNYYQIKRARDRSLQRIASLEITQHLLTWAQYLMMQILEYSCLYC